jgi:hypothetical protein
MPTAKAPRCKSRIDLSLEGPPPDGLDGIDGLDGVDGLELPPVSLPDDVLKPDGFFPAEFPPVGLPPPGLLPCAKIDLLCMVQQSAITKIVIRIRFIFYLSKI